MENQFKDLLLETLRAVKDHPDSANGIGFVSQFDEEPEWKVIISFVPRKVSDPNQLELQLH